MTGEIVHGAGRQYVYLSTFSVVSVVVYRPPYRQAIPALKSSLNKQRAFLCNPYRYVSCLQSTKEQLGLWSGYWILAGQGSPNWLGCQLRNTTLQSQGADVHLKYGVHSTLRRRNVFRTPYLLIRWHSETGSAGFFFFLLPGIEAGDIAMVYSVNRAELMSGGGE